MRPASPKDRLIFALDVDQIDEAERLVHLLAPHVGMFKVGSRLFTSAGPLVIDLINGKGSSVFLDLKFHDIPETVATTAREMTRQRVKLFTVHGLGGATMIRKATAELNQATLVPGIPSPLCVAVTILTSHTEADLAELGLGLPIIESAKRLAKLAMDNGAAGVVASGHEVPTLRQVLPERTIYVVPGIRSQDDDVQDQARVMTAREAVAAGATYVVVGRPIRLANDPIEAAKRIVDEIASAEAP